jgi:4-amino-4-deoxy-L-arabinose transferase-like glycosyltransferase
LSGTPRLKWLLLAGLAAVTVAYTVRLDYSPIYLLNDEIYNGLQAWSLAHTGRSAAGDLLPVFFRGLEFAPGRDPMCVYGTALSLKLLPLGETALRLPTALVGIVNVVLAYFVGKRLWGSRSAGALTAALLATTPAIYIHSRVGIPTLWPLPWLLGWLLGLAAYAQRRDPRTLFLAVGSLGLAVYAYLGTALIVPLLVVITAGFLYGSLSVRERHPYAIAAAALLASMTFVIYWHFLHPERWSELASHYLTGTTVLRQGTPLITSGVPNFAGLQERVTTYWNYFDPTLLFLRGDASPRYSTGWTGAFLFPAMVLLPLGLYRAARTGGMGLVLVASFLAAPVAAALGNEIQLQRALPLVMFGSLLCAWGAISLWRQGGRARAVVAALCIVGALQFGAFLIDYFGHYRLRSGPSRGGNQRDGLALIVNLARETGASRVYLDENITNVRDYWRYYEIVLDAADVGRRVSFVRPAELPPDTPPGTLLFSGAQDGSPRNDDTSIWELRSRVLEPDGVSYYAVLEKKARGDRSPGGVDRP